jgi:hypothetical protein
MKRIVLNRKKSLFVTSSCRRHNVDPQLYFTQLLTNLSTTPPSDLHRWLPDQWKMAHNQKRNQESET